MFASCKDLFIRKESKVKASGFIISLGILASCGRPPIESRSEVKFDIDLPKDDIEPADVQNLLLGFDTFIQEGSNRVSLADFAATINVQGSFKAILDEIVKSRDALADMSCVGRRCQIVTLGKDFSFKLESVNIPVLGTPTVSGSLDTIKIDAGPGGAYPNESCRF
jgi:hypothetical protein